MPTRDLSPRSAPPCCRCALFFFSAPLAVVVALALIESPSCVILILRSTLHSGASSSGVTLRNRKRDTDKKRTKHIAKHFHFVKEKRAAGLVVLKYLATALRIADMFTKQIFPKHI